MSKTHRAGNSEEYLFRPISSSENRKRLVSVNKPISYSAYRDSFQNLFWILYLTNQGLVLIPRDQEELLWQPIQSSRRKTFNVTVAELP